MEFFVLLFGFAAVLFFLYRIWDQLPDIIMALKEQSRELVKMRETLERLSETNN